MTGAEFLAAVMVLAAGGMVPMVMALATPGSIASSSGIIPCKTAVCAASGFCGVVVVVVVTGGCGRVTSGVVSVTGVSTGAAGFGG